MDPEINVSPEEEALFSSIELDTDKYGFKDIRRNSAAAQNGLSDFQRFAVQNFFDTQPKRKKAFLKQLGYEMDKDGEKIRPLDSDGSFKPIDPGWFDGDGPMGFIGLDKMFSDDGRKELLRDLSDISYDTLGAGTLTTVGAVKGAGVGTAAGAAIGSPTGPGAGITAIVGGILGGFTGGAAGNAAAEGIKDVIGDFLLDEEIPMDMKETFYQSLTAGALGSLAKGGGAALKKMIGAWKMRGVTGSGGLKGAKEALKQAAIRKSNGTFSQDLVEDMIQNPKNYTREAVDGATNKLLDFSDEIYGTSAGKPIHTTRKLEGGLVRDVINPLNDRADLEIQKLAKDARARFSVEDLVKVVNKRLEPLTSKKFNTKEEEQAISFLRGEVSRLKAKMIKPKPSPKPKSGILDASGKPIDVPEPDLPDEFEELTFKEGRDLLKSWQNSVYQEGPVKGNSALKGVTADLKNLADKKATKLGSDIADINAERHLILKTKENFDRLIKDGHLQNSYVGKDNISRKRANRMFEEMDRVLGTDLANQSKSLQFQSAVESVYNKPNAMFGNGSAVSEGLKEGLNESVKQAFRYGTAGSVVPGVGPMVGAKFGAVKGGIQGFGQGMSFASPEAFLKKASKIQSNISDIDAGKSIFNALAPATTMTAPTVLEDATEQAKSLLPEEEPQLPVEEQASIPVEGEQAPPSDIDISPEEEELFKSLNFDASKYEF